MSEWAFLLGGISIGSAVSALAYFVVRRLEHNQELSKLRGDYRALQDRLRLAESVNRSNLDNIKGLMRRYECQNDVLGRVVTYLRSQPPRIGDRDYSGILKDVEAAYNKGTNNGGQR